MDSNFTFLSEVLFIVHPIHPDVDL